MRSSILILTTAAAAVVASVTITPAHAQPVLASHLALNIPFAFHLGSKAMPAGRYEVAAGMGGSLWIKTGGKTAISLFRSRTVEPEAKGRMRFDCYGESNKCFLRQVIAAGSDVAMTFPVSRMEKEYMPSGEAVRIAFVEEESSRPAASGPAAAAE